MITYFLNCMGPINRQWIEENGTDWAGGRVDIHIPDVTYGPEYSMPVMKQKDWDDLGNWLWDLETEVPVSFRDMITMYEQEKGTEIEWWQEPAEWQWEQAAQLENDDG
jgi:hypothetical protein